MAIVVDASTALAWGLPDETSAYADAALTVAEQEGMRVPGIWAHEIANGIAIAHVRKTITASDEEAFFAAHHKRRAA